jgi:hypothetical protein
LDTNPNTLITDPNTTKYNLIAENTPQSSHTFSTDLFQGRQYIKGGDTTVTIFKSNSVGPQLDDLKTGDFSVAVWVRAKGGTFSSRYLIRQTSTPSFGPDGLYIGSIGVSTLQYVFGGSNLNILTTDGVNGTYDDMNKWVHIVYVMKNENNNRIRSIYRNGTNIISDSTSFVSTTVYNSPIKLFISPNTDYSDLRIYRKALTDQEITGLYNSYNSNIYSINFNENTSNVIINGREPVILLGNYLISTGYNKSSILPTTQNQIIPLPETLTTTITIKYPTQTYIISHYTYKKDGFLKYVAGKSSLTRDTGVWEITNYDTIGVDNSNYTILTSNILTSRIKDTSNYVAETSNILTSRIKDTSNILIDRINYTNNYIEETSNILIGHIKDTSNYIEKTSNILMDFINNKNFSQWTTSNNMIYYTSNVGICTLANSTNKLNVSGITN